MDTPRTATEISTEHKLNFKEEESRRHHSTEYAKSANASESDFAFTAPSFQRQGINTPLPHSSTAKMNLPMYKACRLKIQRCIKERGNSSFKK